MIEDIKNTRTKANGDDKINIDLNSVSDMLSEIDKEETKTSFNKINGLLSEDGEDIGEYVYDDESDCSFDINEELKESLSPVTAMSPMTPASRP